MRAAADLGCGTGRTGAWLKRHGIRDIDGVDLAAEMLRLAAGKRIYRRLEVSNVAATPFDSPQAEVGALSRCSDFLRHGLGKDVDLMSRKRATGRAARWSRTALRIRRA